MVDDRCQELMRADWNRRAREDANYFVAFGRREQDEAEFFATGADVVRSLERELKRLPEDIDRKARRALEIGCGPGRLMRPMSRHFGEIHGVDVSDEMIHLAEMRLEGLRHAHVHATSGSDLAIFSDEYFDLVYSYAVFQHIPSREVVFEYLREARRVLKTGGVLRCQINGLPATAKQYDTWSGVRISGEEMAAFARENDFQLLELEGVATQYMWVTMRKRREGWSALLGTAPQPTAAIRAITNSLSSEPVVPSRGRLAYASIWIGGLSDVCDLNNLAVDFEGRTSQPCYLGPAEADGLQQLNVVLPPGIRTGLVPVHVCWLGRRVSAPAAIRVIPPGPAVPRLISVSDGVDLCSGSRVTSGCIKITLEEIDSADAFHAAMDGLPIDEVDAFCTQPQTPRYEVNLRLPDGIQPGAHLLEMSYGNRRFAPVPIEVVAPQ